MKANVGTSGYTYDFWGPHPTNSDVKNYYPIKTKTKWLEYYSKDLKSVEINCTRYQKITPKMCKGWFDKTPNDFTITIKAPLYITHQKKLCDFQDWWNEFYPCILACGNKFSSILFQFPPTFKKTPSNLTKLQTVKNVIPTNIRCAFEFRDIEWYKPCEITEKLFIEDWCQVILNVPEVRDQDTNFGNLPGGIHIGILNPKFVYLRFHGTTGYSCGTYGYDKMYETLEMIKAMEPSYLCAYFNNTDSWTMQPYNVFEADYEAGIPVGIQLTPSAIYDSKILYEMLK